MTGPPVISGAARDGRTVGGAMPTAEQVLLLKAALLDGPRAVSAFHRWIEAVDFDGEMDDGSFRLLPLLFHNLRKQTVDHPVMNRLKGIYRYAWYKNHTLFYELSAILRCIGDAGIPTMVIKGAALTLQVYKNFALRPMADIDIIVPLDRVPLADRLLTSAGWLATGGRSLDKDLQFRHSVNYRNADGFEFDLHWHPVKDSSIVARENRYDDMFWQTAVPVRIVDVATLAPGPAESLFLVIMHGSWRTREPSIRWIADAVALIRSLEDDTAWHRFAALAQYYAVPLLVLRALDFLSSTFGITAPAHVGRALERIEMSRLQRTVNRWQAGPAADGLLSLARRVPGLVEYLRVSGDRGLLKLVAGFPGYVRYRMKHKNINDLIAYLSTPS